jgi:hypothetical protein
MTARYGQLANFASKVTDLLLMLIALGLGIVINYAPAAPLPVPEYAVDFFSTRIKVGNALLGVLLLIIWHLAFYFQGVYRSHRLSSPLDRCPDRPLAHHHDLDYVVRGLDCSVVSRKQPIVTAA